jgi:hypothetical protein
MPYRPNGAGGTVWTPDAPTPWGDPHPIRNLLVAGGLSVAAGAALLRPRGQHPQAYAPRPIDYVQKAVRNFAAGIPFEAGNTFRFSELFSPFLSPAGQGLPFESSITGSGRQVGVYKVPHQYINQETKHLLKSVIGQPYIDAGLEGSRPFELRFERDPKQATGGSLFARQLEYKGADAVPISTKGGAGQGWKRVSDSLAIMELTDPRGIVPRPDVDLPIGKVPKLPPPDVNLAAQGMAAHAGAIESMPGGTKGLSRAFADISPEGQVLSRLRHMFIQSPTGPIGSWGDLAKRFSYLGGIASFEMNRFNRLLEATAEQIPLLGKIGEGFGKATGLGLTVTPGPAYKMFAKFGLQAGKVGGGYLLLQQLDWARRQFGLPGEAIASGAVSLTAAHLLDKAKVFKSPKTAMMAGVASFFGQLVLPGWDQGVVEGLSSTWAGANIARSYVGEVTGMSAYRRVVEGYTGMTELGWGVGAGLLLTGASYSKISNKLFRPDMFGLDPSAFEKGWRPPVEFGKEQYFRQLGEAATAQPGQAMVAAPERVTGTLPWNVKEDKLTELFGGTNPEKWKYSKKNLRRLKGEMTVAVSEFMGSTKASKGQVFGWYQDELFARELTAKSIHFQDYSQNNPLTTSLSNQLTAIQKKYRGELGGPVPKGLSRLSEIFEIQGTKLMHAFFGAPLKGKQMAELSSEAVGLKPGLGRAGFLFGAGVLIHQILTGGLLGTLESPQEVRDIYAGRQLVPIRKGRFWEAGGAPYGGAEETYYRPHRHALMMSRARERSIWGSNEDEISPIGKFLRENFTYQLEEMTYYDRPYPISGAGFQNVPIIGDALAATVGGLIKPPKLMHTNEWLRSTPGGGIEFAHKPEFHGPALGLGGTTLGAPKSPFDSSFMLGRAEYQFRELSGLTGWAKNMLQLGITGSETFGTRTPVMESAGMMTSPVEEFWDLALGGALFTSEPVRRFLPRPRAEIDKYNPLINRMPSWIPERLHYGDPYRAIESGYARLPGPGYQALHPEISGVQSEEYPLIHRYSILADVAPTSRSFFQTQERLYTRRAEGITSGAENRWMDIIDRQVAEIAVKRPLEALVHSNATQLPGSGITQGAIGIALDTVRNVVAPAEYMVPMGFRPFQKLVPYSNQIDQYEYERMYGTMNAFWNKPWRDWFRPAIHSAAHLMGWEGKPGWRKEADEINEHFDKLEFEKWMMLAESSTGAERRGFLRKAQNTRHGFNPSGDAMSIYKTLDTSERKFFDAFATAAPDARERILEMVPSDQVQLYKNVWQRIDAGDHTIYPGSRTQINEANLMSRFYDFDNALADQPHPNPDWIGWHQDVDMDDIKLKYVNSLGKDIHEFDMWHKQQRSLARKPYLNGAEGFLLQNSSISRGGVRREVGRLNSTGLGNPQSKEFYMHNTPSNMRSSAQIHYNDDRDIDIRNMLDAL